MVFQKGLDPNRYNGGSVVGHAPTSDGSWLPKGGNAEALREHQFKKGDDPKRDGNGIPATGEQRRCMEAIQRLKSLDDEKGIGKLMRVYPPGMVRRLLRLQKSSENPECSYFLQSQRLIREILIAPKRRNENEDPAAPTAGSEGMTVNVLPGRIDAALPGAPGSPLPPEDKARAGAEREAKGQSILSEKPARGV